MMNDKNPSQIALGKREKLLTHDQREERAGDKLAPRMTRSWDFIPLGLSRAAHLSISHVCFFLRVDFVLPAEAGLSNVD